MKRNIQLHPQANSGEAATATVAFVERAMSLTIETQGYGNHTSSMSIFFDKPVVMKELGETLIEAAKLAQAEFTKTP